MPRPGTRHPGAVMGCGPSTGRLEVVFSETVWKRAVSITRIVAMRHGSTWLAIMIVAVPLVGVTSRVSAQVGSLPDDRLGVRVAPLLLLTRHDVQTDVGLSAEQIREVGVAVNDLWSRAAALRGKKGPQVIAAQKAIDEAHNAWCEAHLSPDQRNRLVQIDLQWEGPAALVSRPLIGDNLSLTPDQKTTLKQAVERRNAARAAARYSPADENTLAQTALSILDETQKKRWHAMLGRPFTPQLTASQPAETTRR